MKVIATELGHDGTQLREPDAKDPQFDIPAGIVDEKGKFIRRQRENGTYYELPHWFYPADKADQERWDAEAKFIADANAKVSTSASMPAVNPGRQAAEHAASVKKLADENEALKKEIEALKSKK